MKNLDARLYSPLQVASARGELPDSHPAYWHGFTEIGTRCVCHGKAGCPYGRQAMTEDGTLTDERHKASVDKDLSA